MSRSARAGIIVKTGGALERLAQAKTVAFDKTGTLTLGQLQVDHVKAYRPFTKDDVLAAAASLEQHSSHVVAQAIVERARQQKLKLAKVKSFKELAGQGLSAAFAGKITLVGRLSYLEAQDVDVSAADAGERTVTYVAINGKLAGAITFSDTIRPESAATIDNLRASGYRHIRMVTGDNAANAQRVAAEVGIDNEHITADALPGGKLRALDAFAERPVVFVGDGVNDAPVLTASEVGIALGARGSTVASQSADIVIMTDDISKVASAAAIAKRTFSIARQSILVGIIISIGLMLAYSSGRFSALSGALIQELVDIIVIFNALRAHGPFNR
jgi:P-type E1-E2 ATPase